MKVRVVAYKRKIVIVPDAPEQGVDNGWYPTSQSRGRGGSVLLDTKSNLGVSEEAFELLGQIKRYDAIGDLSWFGYDTETYGFSWSGPIYRVINPTEAKVDRDFHVPESLKEHCKMIANDVPEAARIAIDTNAEIVTQNSAWAEPYGIE